MTSIELAYGRSAHALIYDEARFSVLDVESAGIGEQHALSDAGINAALDEPIAAPRLEEILEPDDTVLVVVSDATRATASASVVNLLVRRFIACGIAAHDINIIFATGIHRPVTTNEKRELLTSFIAQRIKTIDHDALDSSKLVHLGQTKRGTIIELNDAVTTHTRVILTGGINFHYFAGFTGGRKSICPGLASARTIAATHMLALDFERGGRRAGVGSGRLDGNAVHEECEEIAKHVAPSFLVNTIVDEEGRAVRVFAGDWQAAHRAACSEYMRRHTIEIAEKRELVIASCGGAPYDINLIQAHKTLEMAAQACTEGGTIIWLAECADGLGRADFLKWFTATDSRSLEDRLRNQYEVNGQTAWALLTKAERFRIYLVSNLPNEVVQHMRMRPARSLNEALAGQAAQEKGYIMPRGATLLPVAAAL